MKIFEVSRFKNDWLSNNTRIAPGIWYKYFYEKQKPADERFTAIHMPRVKRKFA